MVEAFFLISASAILTFTVLDPATKIFIPMYFFGSILGIVSAVRRKVGKQIEETRQSGLVGGLIGQKTLTSKGDITRFYCDNCQTKWTA